MDYRRYCGTCRKDVHCCIFEKDSGFTFISPDDAERIMAKTGLHYSVFADFSPLSKEIVDSLREEDPALEGFLRYRQLGKKKRLLRLKKKDSGRCIFLDDQGLCGIYSIRPCICRIFPFWAMLLENGRLKVIEHDAMHGCMIMRTIQKKGDPDSVLPAAEKAGIRKIFMKIMKEDRTYRKDIQGFIQKTDLS